MKQVFNLIEAIGHKVMEYADRTGNKPATIILSRGSYRRILEIKADEGRIGNLIIGCAPMTEIDTPLGKVKVVIDEMLDDMTIETE